jgi:hypothetical protein
MGVALALFLVFCFSISGPLGLRTQNNLMCTIEYLNVKRWSLFVSILPRIA